MKIMSREFSTSEKVLLVVLSVLLLGLIYYRGVFVTTQDMINSLKTDAEDTQAQLDVARGQLQSLQKMQKEMDEVLGSGEASRMESYNNSKKETAFLNQVLSNVSDYSIAFADITRDGNQIRRSFTLQFTTGSYKKAVGVVDDLSNGEYRCLLDDINYSMTNDNQIYINLTATFFETMVGGTPDSALPRDESQDQSGGAQ